jgi:hypothetical protein
MQAAADKAIGLLLMLVTILVICAEWGVALWASFLTPAMMLVLVMILTVQVRLSRKVFVAVAALLSIALVVTNPNWREIILQGSAAAAFIGAFFAALSTLRTVAATSPAIERAGAFLAGQRPGKRYGALTIGGQAFALLLNYGSIQLLGALAMSNAKAEPNAEIREHRIRRMLLAIQRAFISTLPWSPLSFAIAISTTVIPDTSWTQVLVPGLLTSSIIAGIGWAMDSIFKPRLSVVPIRIDPPGTWTVMLPLIVLLATLIIGVIVLNAGTDVRIVGLVAVLVPAIAVAWLFIQHWSQAPFISVTRRISTYILVELPTYRGELILLMMAGYIGTVGSQLLAPIVINAGFDLSSLPTWLILVSFVWIIPFAGQLGMNPILIVTLIAPLIPSAASLGVDPTALVVALTAGWAMSGASSPFTATTLLIGSFAGVSARHVGLIWNGTFTIVCCFVLSLWVLIYAFIS